MSEPFKRNRLHPRYWEEHAACFGRQVEHDTQPVLVRLGIPTRSHTELFYPPRIKEVYHEYADEAKKYCFGPNGRTPCPVRRQCLAAAIVNNEEHGIWGGLSHRERNALIRKAARNAGLEFGEEEEVEIHPDAVKAALDAIETMER